MPKKIKNKAKKGKSIEVKVHVPLSSTSFMSLIFIGLIALIGYSGYLGVSSIWKFTHPQFNVSLDSFRSLEYIAKGISIPPLAGPNYLPGTAPQASATTAYLESVNEYKTEFRAQFPNSKLLSIPDNDVLNIGKTLCDEKQKIIAKEGSYSRDSIIAAYQEKFVIKYYRIPGLSEYLNAIAQRAFDHLCGDN